MSKPNLRQQVRNAPVPAPAPPPLPRLVANCSTCFHFHRNHASSGNGTCHRNPPTQGMNYQNCRSFPPTIGTDVCGEWHDRNRDYFAARLQDASKALEGVKSQHGL